MISKFMAGCTMLSFCLNFHQISGSYACKNKTRTKNTNSYPIVSFTWLRYKQGCGSGGSA